MGYKSETHGFHSLPKLSKRYTKRRGDSEKMTRKAKALLIFAILLSLFLAIVIVVV